VAQVLRDRGFKKAYALAGGFDAWLAASGPVEPK
jgi:rhodanese-related sulfurtransferase